MKKPVNPHHPVKAFPLSELLILLLALFTRVWRLDYHSLWFDEAVSMTWARSAPEYAWDSTFHLVKDKHPPAYYLLLHFWRELFKPVGLENNDVALRLLGSLLGVLTVLGVLLLARRLSGRRTALLAGALTALAPALVWYSQELRMFQPAATALVWGAFFQVTALGSSRRFRRWGWWLAMIAAFTLALYSYLFAAFALPAAGIVLLMLLWARSSNRWTIFVEGSVALAITAALYLPLAFNAWAANASDGAPGQPFMNFWENLQRQLQVATVWRVDWPASWAALALALFALLLLAGLILPWRDAPPVGPPDRLFLLAWLGTPLLVGNLLLARNDTVFAEDRYFLYLAPFALWAVARGAAVIAQYAGQLVGHACSVTRFATTRKQLARADGECHAASLTYVGLGAVTVLLLAAALPRLWSPATLREDWRSGPSSASVRVATRVRITPFSSANAARICVPPRSTPRSCMVIFHLLWIVGGWFVNAIYGTSRA